MKLKRKADIIGQNIKGHAQQAKGEMEARHGQHVKGAVDKIRGKINEAVADIRNKTD